MYNEISYINTSIPNNTCIIFWYYRYQYTWRRQNEISIKVKSRVTQWVPLVVQELFTIPEHLSSYLAFSSVHVAQSLVLCVVFCRSLYCLSVFDLRLLITHLVSSNWYRSVSFLTLTTLTCISLCMTLPGSGKDPSGTCLDSIQVMARTRVLSSIKTCFFAWWKVLITNADNL